MEIPALQIIKEKIRQISPDVNLYQVIPIQNRGIFVFQLRIRDRQCEVELSEEFLEDLRDFRGNPGSSYWQEMQKTLTKALLDPMEKQGVIPYMKNTLKPLIFEHVKDLLKSNQHVNKYNLIGRSYQRGSLEAFLKVKFTDDERVAVGQAFDEMKQQGVLVPTYQDIIAPEDWVKIGNLTPETAPVNDKELVQVADLEGAGEIPIKEIFLGSAVKGLVDCRAEVISELQWHKVKVVHAGAPEFAGVERENAHDICLHNARSAPNFLLILDGRYGELYGGKRFQKYSEISITHAELRVALDNKEKPVFVYVRDRVWEHYEIWKKNSDFKDNDTDCRVFRILRDCDEAGEKLWIDQFRDSVDLKQKLLRRFRLSQ